MHSSLTPQLKNSILWEVSGNGLTSPSCLMGTLKFIGEKEFFIPKEAHLYLKNCRVLPLKIRLIITPSMNLTKPFIFPQGKSLKTELKPEEYAAVQKLFEKEFGISESKFSHQYEKLIPLGVSIAMTRLSLGEGCEIL